MTQLQVFPSYEGYTARKSRSSIEAYLRQHYESKSNAELAAALGMDEGNVKYYLRKFNLTRKHLVEQKEEEILSLYAQGHSITRIMARTGYTRNEVEGALSRNNVQRRASMSAKDQIENSHTEHNIRLMWAKAKAGKGISAKLEDIPQHLVVEATKKLNDDYVLPYEEVISYLAGKWDKFKNR